MNTEHLMKTADLTIMNTAHLIDTYTEWWCNQYTHIESFFNKGRGILEFES